MRNTLAEKACETMRAILEQLAKESVQVDGKSVALTASCGIASAIDAGIDPRALLQRADAAQQQAKKESRGESRRSVLVLEGSTAEFIQAK